MFGLHDLPTMLWHHTLLPLLDVSSIVSLSLTNSIVIHQNMMSHLCAPQYRTIGDTQRAMTLWLMLFQRDYPSHFPRRSWTDFDNEAIRTMLSPSTTIMAHTTSPTVIHNGESGIIVPWRARYRSRSVVSILKYTKRSGWKPGPQCVAHYINWRLYCDASGIGAHSFALYLCDPTWKETSVVPRHNVSVTSTYLYRP
jgi:hypothetical protein